MDLIVPKPVIEFLAAGEDERRRLQVFIATARASVGGIGVLAAHAACVCSIRHPVVGREPEVTTRCAQGQSRCRMDASSPVSTEESRANLYCHREAAAWAAKPRELPVTLVTGFLGSGKTSLLRHILSNKSNLRVAAAVNDFAAVNLDAKLVSRVQQLGGATADQVVELSNGCLCCSTAAASGFSEAVWKVLQECDVGKVQYLVVETSGITDPLSLIGTLDQEFGRLFRVRLDSVVTVVDADTLYNELVDAPLEVTAASAVPRQYIASRDADGVTTFASSVAESQLRCADVVLLNKVDLLSRATADDGGSKDAEGAALSVLTDWVAREVGLGVRTFPCTKCTVPLDAIMEVAQSNLYDEAMKGVHTHERTESNYVVLDANYGARRVGSRSCQAAASSSASATLLPALAAASRRPLATDYAVRVFESPAGGAALPLAAFQDFVGDSFVSCQLIRVKGTVSFVRPVVHLQRAYLFPWYCQLSICSSPLPTG